MHAITIRSCTKIAVYIGLIYSLPLACQPESSNSWIIDKALDFLGINESEDPYTGKQHDNKQKDAELATRIIELEKQKNAAQLQELHQSARLLEQYKNIFKQLSSIQNVTAEEKKLATLGLFCMEAGADDTSQSKEFSYWTLQRVKAILSHLNGQTRPREAWAVIQSATYHRHHTLNIPHLIMRIKGTPLQNRIIYEASTLMNRCEQVRATLRAGDESKIPLCDLIHYIAAATRTMLAPEDHVRAFTLLTFCFSLLEAAHAPDVLLVENSAASTKQGDELTKSGFKEKLESAKKHLVALDSLCMHKEKSPIDAAEWLTSLCTLSTPALDESFINAHHNTLKHMHAFLATLLACPTDLKSLFTAQTPLIQLICNTYGELIKQQQ